MVLLGWSAALGAVTQCQPVSATLTYGADDRFDFWINGNQIAFGNINDVGAPYGTISIPPGDFSLAGTPNYFAADIVNNSNSLVGGTWMITITCADGSLSYITDGDSTFQMYDDTSGGSPPPPDGSGHQWYQSTWANPNPAVYFNATAVQANASAFWFSPQSLVNPVTGATVPILSHSSSGQDSSAAENLYFLSSVVLPVITLTPTPTPQPTICSTPPSLVTSQFIFGGCLSASAPSTALTVPNNPGQILLVQAESSGPVISGATWNGAPLLPMAGSPVSAGGSLGSSKVYEFYLTNPVPGSGTLSIGAPTNGCNVNISMALYQNVDTGNPFGAVQTSSGSGPVFDDQITTTSPYSIIHDLILYTSGPTTGLAATFGTQLFPVAPQACCNATYGSYYNASWVINYNMTYSGGVNSGTNWWGQAIELKAVTNCNGATNTPTPAAPPTMTPTPIAPTRTPTPSFTPPPPGSTATDTPTVTRTPTATWTPSPLLPTNTPAPSLPGFGIVAVYPNPVPGSTGCFIVMSLPAAMTVNFKIYDLRGELIWSGSQPLPAGISQKPWPANNNAGAAVSYGAYFLTANAGSASDSKWLTVVR